MTMVKEGATDGCHGGRRRWFCRHNHIHRNQAVKSLLLEDAAEGQRRCGRSATVDVRVTQDAFCHDCGRWLVLV